MNDISKAAHYRSFYDVTKMMSDDAKLEFYVALDEYRFDDVEPVFTNNEAKIAFTAIRSFVDADLKRKTGGAPVGNGNARKQPKNNVQNNYQNNYENNIKNNLENNYQNNLSKQPKTNNVNVNVNVNENVDVNDKVDLTDGTTDGNSKKLTSDSVHDYLAKMGYEAAMTSCGTIASILNSHDFPLEYCKWLENKVSDRYPEITTSLMVNALTTWVEYIPEYQKELKKTAKKKAAESAPINNCVKCGEKLTSNSWLNGHFKSYFCWTCGTNFVFENGKFIQKDDLSA